MTQQMVNYLRKMMKMNEHPCCDMSRLELILSMAVSWATWMKVGVAKEIEDAEEGAKAKVR